MGGQRVDDLRPDIFRSTGRAPHNPEVGGSDPPPAIKQVSGLITVSQGILLQAGFDRLWSRMRDVWRHHVSCMGQSLAEAMGSPSLDSISAYCLDKSLNLNSLIFAAYLLVMMTPMITVPNSIPRHNPPPKSSALFVRTRTR